jgi:hypothetical protein
MAAGPHRVMRTTITVNNSVVVRAGVLQDVVG